MLEGVHVGCWQLFGSNAITSIRDFIGNTVATGAPWYPRQRVHVVTPVNVGIDVHTDGPTVVAVPLLHGHREPHVMAKNPVATTRALPALDKGAENRRPDPERRVCAAVDPGSTDVDSYAAAPRDLHLTLLTYGGGTTPLTPLCLYAPRLSETGLVKITSDQISRRDTDFHFLRVLKES